jgi:hypothetical protein
VEVERQWRPIPGRSAALRSRTAVHRVRWSALSQSDIKCPPEQGFGMLLAAAGARQEVARTVHETANVPVGPRSGGAVRMIFKE